MLQLKFELRCPGTGGDEKPSFSYLTENIKGELSNVEFEAMKKKHEVGEAIIHTWKIVEQLPYDEGYAAAVAGAPSEANPYAKTNWKHEEWYMGWNSYHESN